MWGGFRDLGREVTGSDLGLDRVVLYVFVVFGYEFDYCVGFLGEGVRV